MRLNWRLTPVSPGETGFRAILTGSAFEITRAFRLWQSSSRAPNDGLTVSLALADLQIPSASSRIDGAPILLLAGEFARFTGRVTQTRANKRNDLHVPNAAFHWSW